MVDLQDLRNEIDSIDRQMTELFEKPYGDQPKSGRIQDQHRQKGV